MSSSRLGWSIGTAALIAGLLFPLYWALASSFTPERQLFSAPTLVPHAFVLDHYRAFWENRLDALDTELKRLRRNR